MIGRGMGRSRISSNEIKPPVWRRSMWLVDRTPRDNRSSMKEVKESVRLEQMIRQQVVARGITEPRVLQALRAVPRGRFFSPDSAGEAYADRAAPIGHGQTISQPYMVALMTERLE